MAFAEKRGKLWRARWKGQDGTLESESGFTSRTAAVKYGQAQEAKITAGIQVDERADQIPLTAWCNVWFPAQDLELNTLDTYKGMIELMILPRFGDLLLSEIEAHDVAAWEKELIARGYKPRTAREARKLLSTILGDAIPRYIKVNTAARKRGKGKKGQRRIAEAEKAEKVWPTPLQALLFAERCAVLTGDDSDFVLNITTFYTGARWSEIMGLGPKCVSELLVNIHWKLYELNGRFYRGRPKDGSIRDADIPPFLWSLLEWQIDTHPDRKCTCANEDEPWCPGMEYVFLAPGNAHHRRSNYSSRVVRPAADGWHPGREGRYGQPPMPVLVDMGAAWPGVPLSSWPAAVPGQPYAPPTGRGVARLVAREGFGRCPACARSTQLRLDGTLINHRTGDERCPGSTMVPGDLPAVASWLPLLAGLTEHGQRHAHQTLLDDLNIRYVLQADRMGHEVPGMRGVYKHIAPEWRADLMNGLQRVWEESLDQRALYSPRSAVPLLDGLLAAHRQAGQRAGNPAITR
jgi:integrase